MEAWISILANAAMRTHNSTVTLRPPIIGLAAIGLVLTPALGSRVRGVGPAPSPQVPAGVRFHHAHYRVADPSAAMNEAARRLEGVRVIVQGLGPGVRAGREYVLFDRAAEDDPAVSSRSARDAYPLAVERLAAWGLKADPPAAGKVRVAAVLESLPVHHLAFVADDFAPTVRRIVDAGAAVLTRRDDSVLFDGGGGVAIEVVRDTDRPETFWCPMHPDVRSADEGKCPVCAMTLVAIPPPKIGEYKLDVSQVRDTNGDVTGLKLSVREPDTYSPVTKFAIVHEKTFHLFIVGRDLRYFAHVHPDALVDGTFALTHPLPPGDYMLIGDFLPEGGRLQMVQKAIIVGGKARAVDPGDQTRGLKVTIQAEDLAPGKRARLTFTVSDSQTGAAVTDLQPYLGAPAHMLMVRGDLGDAIHAHPEEQVASGPTVSFHPIIPAPGTYKLWIQFQRGEQVSTTAFELTVER